MNSINFSRNLNMDAVNTVSKKYCKRYEVTDNKKILATCIIIISITAIIILITCSILNIDTKIPTIIMSITSYITTTISCVLGILYL